MVTLCGKVTNIQELEIQESTLPDNWKDLDSSQKLRYLIDNYKEDIFELFLGDLEVDFDFEEN